MNILSSARASHIVDTCVLVYHTCIESLCNSTAPFVSPHSTVPDTSAFSQPVFHIIRCYSTVCSNAYPFLPSTSSTLGRVVLKEQIIHIFSILINYVAEGPHYIVHRLLHLCSLTSGHNASAIRFRMLTFIPRRLSQARSLP